MNLKDLQLDYPTSNHTVAQGFGENANGSYAGAGLKGHPAIDFYSDYNAPIYSASRGLGRVYKIFNKDNPDLMKYRAPCELIDLEDCSIEITYGHCNHITCSLGPTERGGQLATVGNTGEVYSGNHMVTEAEKEAGSTAGRHLHFQLRKCQRVLKTEADDNFLQDEFGGQYREDGYYYVWKQNGFNGCIDPAPYLVDSGKLTPEQGAVIQQELNGIQKLIQKLVALFRAKQSR